MADATRKAPAPKAKKVTTPTAKTGAADAKTRVEKTEPTKATMKKITSTAGNGKSSKSPVSTVAAKNTPAPRKFEENKATVGRKKIISGEERYRMIAEAAYFRAESHHFESDPVRNWIEAERDIAVLLGENK
jgi:hypothetical protein